MADAGKSHLRRSQAFRAVARLGLESGTRGAIRNSLYHGCVYGMDAGMEFGDAGDMSETLQDSHGEILYRIGQLFQAEIGERYESPPTFEIVIVERDGKPRGSRIVCVRLYQGDFVYQGERFWVEDGKRRPLLYFTEELVASCLRKQYGQASKAAGVAEHKAVETNKSVPQKKASNPPGKKRSVVADVARDDQGSLF